MATKKKPTTWNTACLDWEKRILTGASLLPNLPWSKNGDLALAIFDKLKIPDIPGTPELKDMAGDWQRDLVKAVFGAFKGKARTISEYFALVPKKNSKTFTGATIMLIALLLGERPRAEYIVVAPTKEVADLSFQQVAGMVALDPVLQARCHVKDNIKQIIYRPTGAILKIKAFDTRVVTGAKPAGILIDELHEMSRDANADRVIGQLRGGMISQPESFMLTITTQSERTPSGVFLAELKKARAVRDGRLKAPVLPILYEFPEKVDWRDPANWWMVTPNRGRSFDIERMLPDYEGAVAAGEHELRRWASQHLNVEIGLALMDNAWAGAFFIEEAMDRIFKLDELLERSEVAAVGIDGGGLDDLLGLAVIGREKETGHWLGWCHAWAHTSVLERRKEIAPRLKDFADLGEVTIIENLGEDIDQVADIIEQIEAEGILYQVGCDPAGISDVLDKIEGRGIKREKLVGVSQGWRLGGAIKTVERRLAEGSFQPSNQKLLTWCAGNAKVEQRANSTLITKQASGTAKIDPLMALFDAAFIMGMNPQAMKRRVIVGTLRRR